MPSVFPGWIFMYIFRSEQVHISGGNKRKWRWKKLGPVSRTSRKLFGPEKPFQKPWSLLCIELFMSTGFAFKQSLHFCSVSNLRIVLVFQLRTFKVGFSGPKSFRNVRETGRWTDDERCDMTENSSWEILALSQRVWAVSWFFVDCFLFYKSSVLWRASDTVD